MMNLGPKRIIILALFALMSVFLYASAFGQTADTLSNESTIQQNGQATEEIQLPALVAPSNESISQQEDRTNSLAQTGNLADALTILQPYKDATGLNKTPLILIHGIHGSYDWNQNGIINPSYASYDENGQYCWAKFISYFDGDAGLNSKYEVYIFSYLSDRYEVKEIARSLKNRIDTAINSGWMKDGKIVLLAHSMGGLVARSYMNEYNGGERVEKLITLATPHHGTPAANKLAREYISTDIWFSSAMGIVDLSYWGKYAPYNSWHPDAPNRSDLRWDNYDYRMSVGYNNSQEKNQWLQELNKTTSYDSNVIAYSGYIYLDDPIRTWLIAQYNDPLITIYDVLFYAYQKNDARTNLRVVNILMSEGMNNYYLYNDGLVPVESAEFNLHTIADHRQCAGYDHLDMRDGNTTVCSTGKNLFESVKDDLYALIRLPVYRFYNTRAGFFLFTIYEDEKDSILQNYSQDYQFEGPSFYAYPTQQPGTLPVYRFYNTKTGMSIFTIYESERKYILNLPDYISAPVGFYAYQTQQPGTLPVYRFYNKQAGWVFTINEGEKDSILQSYPDYQFNSVSFYAYPTQ